MNPDERIVRFAESIALSTHQTEALLALLSDISASSGPSIAPLSEPGAASTSAQDRALIDDRERYEILDLLGEGGMGRVFRVRDRVLDRTLAMKQLKSTALRAQTLDRFFEEARVTAQLEHPNIVPVYDFGRMPDGQLFFTMREVRGRTLSHDIRALHAQVTTGALRRLIESLVRCCDAVAYAHARGVLHRDLKPSNVMLGAFGEVQVMDWGLALIRAETGAHGIAGTPAYMAPEQATRQATLDERADIYALGAILSEILSGRPPRLGSGSWVILEAQKTPARPNLRLGDAALHRICRHAMAWEPSARHPSAEALRADLQDWLDGVQRQQQAQALVDASLQRRPEVARLLKASQQASREAERLQSTIRPWDPIEAKRPAWALEDESASLREDAERLSHTLERDLYAAFTYAPDHLGAHLALARLHQRAHRDAEANGATPEARRQAALLDEHLNALPENHPELPALRAYLDGDGAISLQTEPAGARIALYRFEEQDRQQRPVFIKSLGEAPLIEARVPMGSYLLQIEAVGCQVVRYPVHISRQRLWTGAVRLLRPETLGVDDVYIPAGEYLSGSRASEDVRSLPLRDIWLDSFIIQRFPVTFRQYFVFLDELVAQGREDEALRWAPQYRNTDQGARLAVERDEDGRFILPEADSDDERWSLDWPVFLISWHAANTYARWYAQHTGLPWRLPTEYEWEKAARGVDGRMYPWGDHLDDALCNIRHSHPVKATPCSIDAFPSDVSPYGVRGMAGNMVDWCLDPYLPEGQPLDANGRPKPYSLEELQGGRRSLRGGAWGWKGFCSTQNRSTSEAIDTRVSFSFRLCRGLAPGGQVGAPTSADGQARPDPRSVPR